jgi:XTP/dITP diphosphohydrolase
MKSIVLASGNIGKLREFGALLAPLGMRLVTQHSLGIIEANEPHQTFVENALAKARHACRLSGLPALADDSGLCVDLLDGAPGVRSARFAEAHSPANRDVANNAKLIETLRAAKGDKNSWGAEFVCVLVFLRHAGDSLPIIAHGRWRGRIVADAAGAEGFGYDPHFLIPELGQTAAQMSAEVKNRVSHRAQAMAHLQSQLIAVKAGFPNDDSPES